MKNFFIIMRNDYDCTYTGGAYTCEDFYPQFLTFSEEEAKEKMAGLPRSIDDVVGSSFTPRYPRYYSTYRVVSSEYEEPTPLCRTLYLAVLEELNPQVSYKDLIRYKLLLCTTSEADAQAVVDSVVSGPVEGKYGEVEYMAHAYVRRITLNQENAGSILHDPEPITSFEGKSLELGKWTEVRDGKIQRTDINPVSVTKEQGDIYVVRLNPGASLYVRRQPVVTAGPEGATILCDRVFVRNGEICCDGMIRQVFAGIADEYGWVTSDKRLRYYCESRGAKLVKVPGSVPPLHDEDTVMVAAFAQSGTSYYEVPIVAYKQIMEWSVGFYSEHRDVEYLRFSEENYIPSGFLG